MINFRICLFKEILYNFFKNYNNIKRFLNEKRFNKCQVINLNWVIHLDSNQIFYNNRTLKERFPEIRYQLKKILVKSIIRGNLPNIKINNVHIINKDYEACNGFGQKLNMKNVYMPKPDYKLYYIDHYYYKSTEEFINKINRGSCFYGNGNDKKIKRIFSYFLYNEMNSKKITLFEKRTGINITYITLKVVFLVRTILKKL